MARKTMATDILPEVNHWPTTALITGTVDRGTKQAGVVLMALSLIALIASLPASMASMMSIVCLVVLLLAAFVMVGRVARALIGILASIVIAGFGFSGGAGSAQELAVAYAALMLSLKAMEIRNIRDVRVTAILSLVSPLLGIIQGEARISLLIALFVVPAALALLDHTSGVEAGEKTSKLSVYAKGMGKRLLIALPAALLLFYIMPRLDNPIWGRQGSSGSTGMSDTMSPGSISKLLNSPDLAFRAIFDDPTPMGFQPYWRGPVLTVFDGSTWSMGTTPDDGRGNPKGVITPYTMTLEGQKQPFIPVLDMPAAMDRKVGLVSNNLSTVSTGRYDRRQTLRLGAVLNGKNEAPLGTLERKANLALPQGFNPRALAMAQKMRTQSASDQDYIKRVAAYFKANLSYTLEPPLLGRDRVDGLLFETKLGFCEHFASSFAVLMRAGGIPTRIVTGYQGGERIGNGDLYTVRQMYAHAWTEVWLEGQGWTRMDPTTFVTSQRPIQANEGFIGNAMRSMSFTRWIGDKWERTIGGFNADSQRYIATRAFQFAQSKGLPEGMAQALFSALGLILLVGAVVLLLPRNKKNSVPVDRLEAAWAVACARLRNITAIPNGVTPAQAAGAAIKALRPESALAFRKLANSYSVAQYAPDNNSISRVELARSLRKWRARRKKK